MVNSSAKYNNVNLRKLLRPEILRNNYGLDEILRK
jgi:hypothetical protein